MKKSKLLISSLKQLRHHLVVRLFLVLFFLFLFDNAYCQLSLSYIPAKENFIYAGVDNIVTINGLNQLENPIVRVVWGSLKKIGDQSFSINPMNVDSCLVFVKSFLDTQFTFSIKVKPIPEPDPYLNKILRNGFSSDMEVRALDSLFLTINNFDWEVFFKIDSFKITRITSQSIKTITNIGAQFSGKAKELVRTASKGDIYIFDTIIYTKVNEKLQLSKNIVLRIL